MVAWIALIIAVFTSIVLIIHAALADNMNGGRAHEMTGMGQWLVNTFPSLKRNTVAMATVVTPSETLQYRPDVRGHAITPTESFLANIALDARGIGLEGSQS